MERPRVKVGVRFKVRVGVSLPCLLCLEGSPYYKASRYYKGRGLPTIRRLGRRLANPLEDGDRPEDLALGGVR